MTTAYVVQVDLPKGTKYLGQSGKLRLTPKFFLSAPAVRSYLKQRTHFGDDQYDAARHSSITKILTIRELESGLKNSKAEVDFYTAFMEKTAPISERAKLEKNAIYKLRLADGKFVSFGKPKPKHGKIWNRAGDLRSHITTHLGYQARLLTSNYKNAEVIEIVMSADGIMPAQVNVIPILKFYTDSPSSRKHYMSEMSNIPAPPPRDQVWPTPTLERTVLT